MLQTFIFNLFQTDYGVALGYMHGIWLHILIKVNMFMS